MLNASMSCPKMIPLGYMLKQVTEPAPEWMNASAVEAVHSLSNCVSSDFADYIPLWKHNGWWLFDSPETVQQAALEAGVPLQGLSLFYYEAFGQQFDDQAGAWQPLPPPDDFPTDVQPPTSALLSGFDVVTFCVGTSPECSPLSCNGLAVELGANDRCLFDSFEQAHRAVESGAFVDSEPGPYRVIAVYKIDPD